MLAVFPQIDHARRKRSNTRMFGHLGGDLDAKIPKKMRGDVLFSHSKKQIDLQNHYSVYYFF